eukprot:m.100243 g.100243  ORF g.100243 m.100243 type:complete len:113 (-) comp13695_c0_seq2:5-343(-)
MKACNLVEPKGCQNAGLILKTGYEGVTKDIKSAVDLFTKACEGGEANGCFFLGLIHGNFDKKNKEFEDKPKGLENCIKACSMGHYMGCVNASIMLSKGRVKLYPLYDFNLIM